jgi:hypothetical protein
MSNRYDYWLFENVFNKEKIVEINNFIDNNFNKFEEDHKAARDLQGNKKKSGIVKIINYEKIKHLLSDIVDRVINVAEIEFGYLIYGLKNRSELHLNIYSSDNLEKYDWHTDQTKSDLHDIKLTVLINLSMEQYEEGQFQLFNTNEYEVKELNIPGNVIMFKSYINHRVLPVTKGQRRTLAIFLKGPKFR